ncbi:MAG TPA: hypothetical protein H9805_04090 [Candidatus Janibacter merdipullorum]|nr:hypothetical protein [Candidatus Janibacter merdipullorum]
MKAITPEARPPPATRSAGSSVSGVGQELVRSVAVAVGDEDLLAGEEQLSAGDLALEAGVLADLGDPGENDVAGARGDEAGRVGLERAAQADRVERGGVQAGLGRGGPVDEDVDGAGGGEEAHRVLLVSGAVEGGSGHDRQVSHHHAVMMRPP